MLIYLENEKPVFDDVVAEFEAHLLAVVSDRNSDWCNQKMDGPMMASWKTHVVEQKIVRNPEENSNDVYYD